MLTLGLLASHRGSNAEAIVRASRDGRLDANVGVIISNNANAPVLDFAATAGIPNRRIGGSEFADESVRDAAVLRVLLEHRVDLVVLAGYLRLLGPKTICAFRDRILNRHPALLPRHGGRGMYGIKVHQAVVAAGDRYTGITVHLVDEQYDHGETIAHAKWRSNGETLPNRWLNVSKPRSVCSLSIRYRT